MSERIFTEIELNKIASCMKVEDEVLVCFRRGAPQTKYIMEVPYGSVYWEDNQSDPVLVPNELIGFWMSKESDNLSDTSLYDCVMQGGVWIKCHKVKVNTFKWIQTKEKLDD